MEYPKILVVNGDPFNKSTATGITLCNLFQGWPKEAIAQIYTFPVNVDTGVCERNWHLVRTSFPVTNCIKSLVRKSQVSDARQSIKKLNNASVTPMQPLYYSSVSAWSDLIPLHTSAEFLSWVEDFKPELIYTLLGNIRITGLVSYLAKRFSLPVMPHFMDDWPTTRYADNAVEAIPRAVLLSRLRRVLSLAPSGMTICEAMSEEYIRRYGLNFNAFMNCVDTTSVSECHAKCNGDTVVFGYVGGLHLNRWISLRQVGEALQKVKNEGFKVELIIHAPPADIERYCKSLEEVSVIRIGGSLSQEEVIPALQGCDVLVHIESFDERDRLYTRLSVSTKIPQYMSVGRPILACGPAEAASCRYIEAQHCGFVVSSPDTDSIAKAALILTGDEKLRFALAKKARETADKNHNAVIERERFRQVLCEAVLNGK